MPEIEIVATPELGDRSYVAHDGAVAVVVDPQRDVDRIESVLERKGLSVELVLETHVHNDYVTGGLELARRTGARYVLSAQDDVGFDRHAISDGDEIAAGSLVVRAMSTPGHTDTHMAYVVSDAGEASGAPAIFTGGSLLYGSVGRTDLLGPDRTEELTRAQFRSARRLALGLAEDVEVFPTHGFGSFCSAGAAAGGDASTIGAERRRNDALLETDEDRFVDRLIRGLTAYPAYYAHMGPLNRAGPGPADLSPATSIDQRELRARIADGQWVVDLRDRTAYAAEHIGGTVSMPVGGQFATFLGWLVPWGSPITLVGSSAAQVASAQRELVRIGIERPAGAAIGTPSTLADQGQLASYRRATFAELAARRAQARQDVPDAEGDLVLLDVRRDDEHAAGAVPGALHVPLHTLPQRVEELPAGEIWVHCASGFRAGIAASLLARAGRRVVHIDDEVARAQAGSVAAG